MINQLDKKHLRYAADVGRVLYSFNVGGFYELHRQYMNEGREHAGIVLATQQRYDVGERMRRLFRLRAERTAEDMQNRVVSLASIGD